MTTTALPHAADAATRTPSTRGVAVVTGGTAGLGRAITRELTARGWDVAVLARGQDGLDATVAEIEAAGRRGLGVPTDVSDADAVEAAADRVEAELGEIELWVNDAMVGVFGSFLDVERDDFRRAFEVVYFGFVNGTRAALSRMTPRGHGHVIQVGSALAHRGIPMQSGYCSAKFAIQGFTESLWAEMVHDGSPIKLSIVDMPAMNTPQFSWVKSLLPEHPQPVPPILQPEICAAAVADVADKPRKRTWVGESTVATIVGNRVAPWFLDWYLGKTGVSGQQAPEVDEPMLPSNLYEPVPGDHGAHGAFDHTAKNDTLQTRAIRHRGAVWTGVAAAGVLGAAGVIRLLKR